MTISDTIKGVIGMDPTEHADADMKAVLAVWRALHAEPIESCSVALARRQPGVAQAVRLLVQRGLGADPAAAHPLGTAERMIPGAEGSNRARVYTPAGAGPFPVILYFHGGGWVIGDLDSYDATPRAMAAKARAIVVSVQYRRAPEHPLPAAHEDAGAAWVWLIEHAQSLGGDARRIAVMGENAGANLAIHVAMHARDSGLQMPLHQALIYPVASSNTVSLSYEENRHAQPLNKPMMQWFFAQLCQDKSDLQNPLIDVVNADLAHLPPATVISAGIDPLRSDAEKLVEQLRLAGVAVEYRNYQGATHEFFGMAEVVQAARDAQAFVVETQRHWLDRGEAS